jgi:hypothetical protein
VKDPYVPFLRMYSEAMGKNPRTVQRIAKRVLGLGVDDAIEALAAPDEVNRQMGLQVSLSAQRR